MTSPWLPLAALASLDAGAAEFCLCVPRTRGPAQRFFFFLGVLCELLCSPFLLAG